ncbi:YcxB family protein [Streptococcus gordonii]|uniref:YcxB family protein n=1 Tax=Streptococcus gordonii TaxID=1302 RepID=UPI000779DA8E|nr:YcxB family protein [Streptococcus gordonii]
MFPMTAKTTMTEEAYRRFAWANFWHRKTGLFPLIIGEVALLAVGLVCLFFREPLPAIGIFIFMPIMPFLLYRSFNQQFLKLYRDDPLWHDLEQEFNFYETDFQVLNRNHTSRYNYQDIVAILDKPESFYIMVGRSMGLILDKADCQPELIDFLLKLKENRSL